MEAEPILVIPHGEVVTLTREGAENGYVTVDYGGVRGWAYADLLGETVGSGQSGTRGVTTVTNETVAPVSMEPAPVSAAPVPVAGECDPSYPDLCIPPAPPYLNCDHVYGLGMSHITVYAPDPHDFDNDSDGVGCENP
jgi:micrococcal nuclease